MVRTILKKFKLRTRIKLILQVVTFRLRTDRSGRPVLTNGKLSKAVDKSINLFLS